MDLQTEVLVFLLICFEGCVVDGSQTNWKLLVSSLKLCYLDGSPDLESSMAVDLKHKHEKGMLETQ